MNWHVSSGSAYLHNGPDDSINGVYPAEHAFRRDFR